MQYLLPPIIVVLINYIECSVLITCIFTYPSNWELLTTCANYLSTHFIIYMLITQCFKLHFKQNLVNMIFFKMSPNLIFHCIKRHLKLANVFYAVFVKLDKQSDKLIIVNKNVERIVVAFKILQILMIIVKIWSTIAAANNLTGTILGVSLVSLYVTPFLLQCHISSDYVQVQFLNYVFFTKGTMVEILK